MLFPGEAVGFTTYAHCFIPVQSISGDLSKLQSLISRILLVGDHYPKEVGHTRISETTKTNLTCLTCFLSGDLWTPKHPLPTKVLRLRAHTHTIYTVYIYIYICIYSFFHINNTCYYNLFMICHIHFWWWIPHFCRLTQAKPPTAPTHRAAEGMSPSMGSSWGNSAQTRRSISCLQGTTVDPGKWTVVTHDRNMIGKWSQNQACTDGSHSKSRKNRQFQSFVWPLCISKKTAEHCGTLWHSKEGQLQFAQPTLGIPPAISRHRQPSVYKPKHRTGNVQNDITYTGTTCFIMLSGCCTIWRRPILPMFGVPSQSRSCSRQMVTSLGSINLINQLGCRMHQKPRDWQASQLFKLPFGNIDTPMRNHLLSSWHFNWKNMEDIIHPASRGVAAHTAGLFRSVRGAKGGFPPWGLFKLRSFNKKSFQNIVFDSVFPMFPVKQTVIYTFFAIKAVNPSKTLLLTVFL